MSGARWRVTGWWRVLQVWVVCVMLASGAVIGVNAVARGVPDIGTVIIAGCTLFGGLYWWWASRRRR